ncbi:hypothetical protein Kpol_2000p19 [Vanderwaltozyma polyspora DSM 70294]|uniref:Non-classical export protein 1 n=1 Tax=Vanderwaltozyma polyspora (strain ATCC 22028 / DSM 70294 / BCRC 21397 / CBS 2163 / NBRC 10782 / NRRL Y-8283 / UCD 57-17) TaxID=436907 RepID=A7TF30_VANPO|nr:uncharacterized protein Kpol_2000p19 [Vanderwaltozyma polyspora DSM 70294]EDO19055.1 hypothetical protein Kpol_2000p19 [Vanderwaltozyma polyspora DSM 70294]
MVQQAPFLFGKFLDPFLAFVVGTTSYYAFEYKTKREEGHYLNQLLMKRWNERGNVEKNDK